jgi:hypothetical protein
MRNQKEAWPYHCRPKSSVGRSWNGGGHDGGAQEILTNRAKGAHSAHCIRVPAVLRTGYLVTGARGADLIIVEDIKLENKGNQIRPRCTGFPQELSGQRHGKLMAD